MNNIKGPLLFYAAYYTNYSFKQASILNTYRNHFPDISITKNSQLNHGL
jgi:hypothetical protein